MVNVITDRIDEKRKFFPVWFNNKKGEPVLVIQSHPVQKICLNGIEITLDTLIEKLESLKQQ